MGWGWVAQVGSTDYTEGLVVSGGKGCTDDLMVRVVTLISLIFLGVSDGWLMLEALITQRG